MITEVLWYRRAFEERCRRFAMNFLRSQWH